MIEIIIRGPHNSGRTTAARFIQEALKDQGYSQVKVDDTEPLPGEQKLSFPDRFFKNREMPVFIKVESTGEKL